MVCTSLWAGLLVTVLVVAGQHWNLGEALLTWLGLAGGALVLERFYMQGLVKHGPF